ncbi:hypothetical protein A0H81_13852 [Grifola frondosa]|uniref:Uncharacterized protein n=1 Tax=Grifola frondosa TaxID=5627 RepID=A0A1C7LQZ7_GRIFR|nr:hypothetical protein A0H81_13852 [Grifola frondosa]
MDLSESQHSTTQGHDGSGLRNTGPDEIQDSQTENVTGAIVGSVPVKTRDVEGIWEPTSTPVDNFRNEDMGRLGAGHMVTDSDTAERGGAEELESTQVAGDREYRRKQASSADGTERKD